MGIAPMNAVILQNHFGIGLVARNKNRNVTDAKSYLSIKFMSSIRKTRQYFLGVQLKPCQIMNLYVDANQYLWVAGSISLCIVFNFPKYQSNTPDSIRDPQGKGNKSDG